MSNEEILVRLEAVFHRVLNDRGIRLTMETTANDVEGWDSLSHVMLVVDIEEAFRMRFGSREIQNWKSVADMVHSIQKA